MANEKFEKLVKALQDDAALREKIAAMNNPEEMLKFANDSGYDVTMEELEEVDKALREAKAEETEEVALSFEDVENVAGGIMTVQGEDASDGHEIGCSTSYHGYKWCVENDEWCIRLLYCTGGNVRPSCAISYF